MKDIRVFALAIIYVNGYQEKKFLVDNRLD